jgi:hypothetical protein
MKVDGFDYMAFILAIAYIMFAGIKQVPITDVTITIIGGATIAVAGKVAHYLIENRL